MKVVSVLWRWVLVALAAMVLAAPARATSFTVAGFTDATTWQPADIQHMKALRQVARLVQAQGKPVYFSDADIERALQTLESSGRFPLDVASRFIATMNLHNRDWGHCPADWHDRMARGFLRASGLDGGLGFRHLRDAGLGSAIPLLKYTAVRALTRPGSLKGEYSLDIFCSQVHATMARELGKFQPEIGRIIINVRHPFLNDPAFAQRELYVFMHEYLHWAGWRGEIFPTATATLLELGGQAREAILGGPFRAGNSLGGHHVVRLSDFGASYVSLLFVGGAYWAQGDFPRAEAVLKEAARRFARPDVDPLSPLMDPARAMSFDPRWVLLSVQRSMRRPEADALLAGLQRDYPNWASCRDVQINMAEFQTPCSANQLLVRVAGFMTGGLH